MQMLTQLTANSCQLAQGLVVDAFTAMGSQKAAQMGELSLINNITDAFNSFRAQVDRLEDLVPAAEQNDEIIGNHGWIALRDSGANSWFVGGSNDLLHAILTVTGTVIVGELLNEGDDKYTAANEGENAALGRNHNIQVRPGSTTIAAKDFLEGSASVRIWRCSDETAGCLTETAVTLAPFEGFTDRLDATMRGGSGAYGGILQKLVDGGGVNTLTPAEEAFLLSANGMSEVGAWLIDIAESSPQGSTLAYTFYDSAKQWIALEMTRNMFQNFFKAIDQAASSEKATRSAYYKELQRVVQDSRENVMREIQSLESESPDRREIFLLYKEMMETLDGLSGLAAQ